jgi:hypothetical protein
MIKLAALLAAKLLRPKAALKKDIEIVKIK